MSRSFKLMTIRVRSFFFFFFFFFFFKQKNVMSFDPDIIKEDLNWVL